MENNNQTVDIDQIVGNISQLIDEKLGNNNNNAMTPEQREEMNYKLREEFDNDPLAFMEKYKSESEQSALKKFEETYGSLLQNTQQLNTKLAMQDATRQFLTQNPNANEYIPLMQEILNQNPYISQAPNPLQIAYELATAKSVIGQGGDVVSGVLGNENYRNKLKQDETLRKEIITEYQNSLNNGGGTKLPSIMGNSHTGSSISASSGESPMNLKQARESALRRLQGM